MMLRRQSRWARRVSAATATVAVFAAFATSSDAQDVPVVQLQSIDVELGTDGGVQRIDALNYLIEATGDRKQRTSDDQLDPETRAADLPVSISTTYRTADRVGTDLADLAKMDGRVEISLTVTNRTGRSTTLAVSDPVFPGAVTETTALVFQPLTVIGTAILPEGNIREVVAEDTNGSVARRDGKVVIQWGALLAPPALAASTTFRFVVDADSFKLESLDLSVEPGQHTDFSLDRIVDQLFGESRQEDLLSAVDNAREIGVGLTSIRRGLDVVAENLTDVTEKRSDELVSVLTAALTDLTSQAESLRNSVSSQADTVDQSTGSAIDSGDRTLSESLNTLLDSLGMPEGGGDPAEESVLGLVKQVVTDIGSGADPASVETLVGQIKLAIGAPPQVDYLGAGGLVGVGPPGAECAELDMSVQCQIDRAFAQIDGSLRSSVEAAAASIDENLDTLAAEIRGNPSDPDTIEGAQDALEASLLALVDADVTLSGLDELLRTYQRDVVNSVLTALLGARSEITDGLSSLAEVRSRLESARASLADPGGAVAQGLETLGTLLIAIADDPGGDGLPSKVAAVSAQLEQISGTVCAIDDGLGGPPDPLDQELSDLRHDLTGEVCGVPAQDPDRPVLMDRVQVVDADIETLVTAYDGIIDVGLPRVLEDLDSSISRLDDVLTKLERAGASVDAAVVLLQGDEITDAAGLVADAAASVTDAVREIDDGVLRTEALADGLDDRVEGLQADLGTAEVSGAGCPSSAATTPFGQIHDQLQVFLGCSESSTGVDDEIAAGIDDKLDEVAGELSAQAQALQDKTEEATSNIAVRAEADLTNARNELAALREDVARAMSGLKETTGAALEATSSRLDDDVSTVFRALTGSGTPTTGAGSLGRAPGGFQRQLFEQLQAMNQQGTQADEQASSSSSFQALRHQALVGQEIRHAAQVEGLRIAGLSSLFDGTAPPGSVATTIYQFHLGKVG